MLLGPSCGEQLSPRNGTSGPLNLNIFDLLPPVYSWTGCLRLALEETGAGRRLSERRAAPRPRRSSTCVAVCFISFFSAPRLVLFERSSRDDTAPVAAGRFDAAGRKGIEREGFLLKGWPTAPD